MTLRAFVSGGRSVRWGVGHHGFGLYSPDSDVAARAALVFRPWMSPYMARVLTWSWTVVPAADPDAWTVRLERDTETIVRGNANRAVAAVETLAVHTLLTALAPEVLTLHAALVARNGRGILLLGRCEAGKSTLACALWQRGFSLLGDDVALVHPERLEARSAPRRVSLRTPSRELLGEPVWARILAAPSTEPTADGCMFHPHEVDGQRGPPTVRLAACVFLARRGARLRPGGTALLAPAQAVLALLPYSNLIHRLDAGIVIDRVAPMAGALPAYDLGRGSLPRMAAAVERLLESAH